MLLAPRNPTAQRTQLVALLLGLWHEKPYHRFTAMSWAVAHKHRRVEPYTLFPTCSAILTIGLCWLTCQRWPGLIPLSPLATRQICLPSLLPDPCPIQLTRWAQSILHFCLRSSYCKSDHASSTDSDVFGTIYLDPVAWDWYFLYVFIAMFLNHIRSFGLRLLVIRPHRCLCPHLKISNLKDPDQACLCFFFGNNLWLFWLCCFIPNTHRTKEMEILFQVAWLCPNWIIGAKPLSMEGFVCFLYLLCCSILATLCYKNTYTMLCLYLNWKGNKGLKV